MNRSLRTASWGAVGGLVMCMGLLSGMSAGGVPAARADDTTSEDGGRREVLSDSLERLAQSASSRSSRPGDSTLPVNRPGGGSLRIDDEGRVSVTVRFAAEPTSTALDQLAGLGEVVSVSTRYPVVTARVPVGQLTELSTLPGVVAADAVVTPSLGPRSGGFVLTHSDEASGQSDCRSIPVDADGPLRSAKAREVFGVDGTGVTVGIISDSYDTWKDAPTHAAQDVASGVLPGAGNPCGFEQPVVVLDDYDADGGGSDEGRAMAQLIHGIAPGAELMFATGYDSRFAFAQAILDLADAGADVIVDDLGYADEPFYQTGVVGAAIDEVSASGVVYVTAGGNDNALRQEEPGVLILDEDWRATSIASWETLAYTPTSCPPAIAEHLRVDSDDVDCNDFAAGTGGAADNTDTLSVIGPDDQALFLDLQWGVPMDASGAAGDFSAYLLGSDGEIIDPDAREGDTAYPLYLRAAPLPPEGDRWDLVIARNTSGGEADRITPQLKVLFIGALPFLLDAEYHESTATTVVGPSIYGQVAEDTAVGVAAAPADDSGIIETFSSLGPAQHLFGPEQPDGRPAAPLADTGLIHKPDVTAVDGVQTSFFYPRESQPPYLFYGTSAAAPNAAGVAALALEYSHAPAAVIRETLRDTASPLPSPYMGFSSEDVYGGGLVDAEAMLGALTTYAPPTPSPTPAPTTAPAAGPTAPETLAATGTNGSIAYSEFIGFALLAVLGATVWMISRRLPLRGGRIGAATRSTPPTRPEERR